jgi:hypothetical protein
VLVLQLLAQGSAEANDAVVGEIVDRSASVGTPASNAAPVGFIRERCAEPGFCPVTRRVISTDMA